MKLHFTQPRYQAEFYPWSERWCPDMDFWWRSKEEMFAAIRKQLTKK